MAGGMLADRYLLCGEAFSGRFLATYAAQDIVLGTQVEVDVLSCHREGFPLSAARLRELLDISLRMRGPHVFPLFAWWEEEGCLYAVRASSQGVALAELLRQTGNLPAAQVVEIVAAAVQVLSEAYGLGLYYLGLSPHQVFIGARGKVGLARAGYGWLLEEAEPALLNRVSVYRAPETDGGREGTRVSDVFSLAVMVGEMLPEEAMTDRLHSLLQRARDPLPQRRPSSPRLILEDLQAALRFPHDGGGGEGRGSLDGDSSRGGVTSPGPGFFRDADASLDGGTSRKGGTSRDGGTSRKGGTSRDGGTSRGAVAPREVDASHDGGDFRYVDAKAGGPFSRMDLPRADGARGTAVPADQDKAGRRRAFARLLALMLAGGLAVWLVFGAISAVFTRDRGGEGREDAAGEELKVILPDLQGMTAEEAVQALEELGLAYEVREAPSRLWSAGRVVAQEPAQGSALLPGEVINLVVSSGRGDAGTDGGWEAAPPSQGENGLSESQPSAAPADVSRSAPGVADPSPGGVARGNSPPRAAASLSCRNGSAPLCVRMDASGSYDPDGDIVRYLWRCGDGTVLEGASVQHVFDSAVIPARFQVILEVIDSRGARGIATATVEVY